MKNFIMAFKSIFNIPLFLSLCICFYCLSTASLNQAQLSFPPPNMSQTERTYIMVKPDGVERGLVGEIIKRFEAKGYQLCALELMQPSKDLLEQHYRDLASKPFFPKLVAYMSSGPVVGMVWQGKEVVKTGRKMLGATNPLESAPGTIRGDFCVDVGQNLCHGSDSVESAEREIALWFPRGAASWTRRFDSFIYE
ncbi:hypothetical protein BB560_005128 [Smittium megazygosporum]|uniref:Nucleoside diphosphate kinase n=1 Tax=Smittium megazygosporum TaxID=133381 RepID=A0A2T9Z7C0_9FUNG|nr:hypothetical protein BB560_005128 [Smittium megazygosporum]